MCVCVGGGRGSHSLARLIKTEFKHFLFALLPVWITHCQRGQAQETDRERERERGRERLIIFGLAESSQVETVALHAATR